MQSLHGEVFSSQDGWQREKKKHLFLKYSAHATVRIGSLFKFLLFKQHETLWPEFPRRNPAKQIHTVLCGTAVRQGDYSCTFTLNERTLNSVLWQFDWAGDPASWWFVITYIRRLPRTRLWEKSYSFTPRRKSQIISRGHLSISISY